MCLGWEKRSTELRKSPLQTVYLIFFIAKLCFEASSDLKKEEKVIVTGKLCPQLGRGLQYMVSAGRCDGMFAPTNPRK